MKKALLNENLSCLFVNNRFISFFDKELESKLNNTINNIMHSEFYSPMHVLLCGNFDDLIDDQIEDYY